MKATLLIAAALLGTAAVAQTTPATTNPAGTDANTLPATGLPADNNTPSIAPAMSSDTSSGMATNAQAVPPTDTSNYPVCSRTVRDKCIQRGAVHKAHPHH
jgi:hypothetical protein